MILKSGQNSLVKKEDKMEENIKKQRVSFLCKNIDELKRIIELAKGLEYQDLVVSLTVVKRSLDYEQETNKIIVNALDKRRI